MNQFTIIDIFVRNSRNYILFRDDAQKEWLFFSHADKPIRSLFFGSDFTRLIAEIRQDPSLCIECNLSSAIQGGISLDGEDLVELQLKSNEANAILHLLSSAITDNKMMKDFSLKIHNWQFPEK